MNTFRRGKKPSRRAATLVLAALLLVFMVGMVAFGVDMGYVVLTRTQLQTAADSAAMAASSIMNSPASDIRAVAKSYAGKHKSGGQTVSMTDSDIEFGTWDSTTRAFTSSSAVGNAIRVTARRDNATTFFGRIFNFNQFSTSASAVAMANPRDICFVVDLSGSMNDDSEPAWATDAITTEFTPQGYATVGTDLMTQVFSDFNFGTFPGTLNWVGLGQSGVSQNSAAYADLTKNSGPLTGASVNATYKILSGDSESTRKTKAYKWIIANQLATLMPNAKPTPSVANLAYWEKYLDYVIQPYSAGSRGTLPPNQDSDRISGLNNPNNDNYPDAAQSVPDGYRNKLGYRTYVQFMMDFGRNIQPDGSHYTPLSTLSSDCPYHTESTTAGSFSFPPREQPMHAARRAIIAAMKVIKDRNISISDLSQRDWVSIVTFDLGSPAPVVRYALSGNYDAAMTSCTTMQCVSDMAASTATENGLVVAYNHLQPSSGGGSGRQNAQKVVVLLTDGAPNVYQSSTSTINNYVNNNPSSNFYSSGGSYAQNAPLMQATTMQLAGWAVFPVGLGLGTNYDFMDRMARMGGTDDDSGQSPRGSGNPAQYEQRLIDIFTEIITNPKVRLVQ